MVKYQVEFYFGVFHVNPFMSPHKTVVVEVDKSLNSNEIIAAAWLKVEKGAYPRTYATTITKLEEELK